MTESVERTLTERQRYWLEQVQACEATGKTVAEYAMDQGIDVKAMYVKGCQMPAPRHRPVRLPGSATGRRQKSLNIS